MSSNYTVPAMGEYKPPVYIYADGTEKEQTKEEWMLEKVPPRQAECRLRLVAFAKPQTVANKFKDRDPDGPDEITQSKLLLEFVDGPGKGKQTSVHINWNFGERSHLVRVWKAILGAPPKTGEDATSLIGGEFRAVLKPSDSFNDQGDPKYTKMVWETVAPATAETAADDADLWK